MASENSATIPQDPTKVSEGNADLKGKGKATATQEPVDQSMDEDEDDDSGDEEVSFG